MLDKIKSMLGGNKPDYSAEDVDEVEVQPAMLLDMGPAPASPHDSAAEQALLAGELRAARKIQMGLVPKTFPPIPGCHPFDLYAILEPAREIGGDFYDFWLNGRDNLMLVIGDVSGKGIPAALFMAVCRTYLRAFSRSIKEPAKLLEYLNNELSRHNDACMFVTLICATVNIPTGQVTYANAGHNPPYLRKRDGSVFRLDLARNIPVGFIYGTEFVTNSLCLEAGDSLLFYTDGMPEAFNAKREMLGDEKSMALFKASSVSGNCRNTVGQLRAEISEFTGDAEQSDDITLMMYGQLDQSRGADLSSGRDMSDSLKGETGVFTLSNLNEALSNPGGDSGAGLSGTGKKK